MATMDAALKDFNQFSSSLASTAKIFRQTAKTLSPLPDKIESGIEKAFKVGFKSNEKFFKRSIDVFGSGVNRISVEAANQHTMLVFALRKFEYTVKSGMESILWAVREESAMLAARMDMGIERVVVGVNGILMSLDSFSGQLRATLYNVGDSMTAAISMGFTSLLLAEISGWNLMANMMQLNSMMHQRDILTQTRDVLAGMNVLADYMTGLLGMLIGMTTSLMILTSGVMESVNGTSVSDFINNSVGVVGALLSLAGLLAAPVTGGASLSLTAAGLAIAGGGLAGGAAITALQYAEGQATLDQYRHLMVDSDAVTDFNTGIVAATDSLKYMPDTPQKYDAGYWDVPPEVFVEFEPVEVQPAAEIEPIIQDFAKDVSDYKDNFSSYNEDIAALDDIIGQNSFLGLAAKEATNLRRDVLEDLNPDAAATLKEKQWDIISDNVQNIEDIIFESATNVEQTVAKWTDDMMVVWDGLKNIQSDSVTTNEKIDYSFTNEHVELARQLYMDAWTNGYKPEAIDAYLNEVQNLNSKLGEAAGKEVKQQGISPSGIIREKGLDVDSYGVVPQNQTLEHINVQQLIVAEPFELDTSNLITPSTYDGMGLQDSLTAPGEMGNIIADNYYHEPQETNNDVDVTNHFAVTVREEVDYRKIVSLVAQAMDEAMLSSGEGARR